MNDEFSFKLKNGLTSEDKSVFRQCLKTLNNNLMNMRGNHYEY